MPEGELSRSPRERLLPLIIGMQPDLRSCLTITNSLSHVYYGLHHICMDRSWIDQLEALKDEGMLYREAFDLVLEIFRENERWKPLVRDMNILADSRPDRVWGRKRVIQVVERPPLRRPSKKLPSDSEP